MSETLSLEEIARRIASETGGFTGGPVDSFGDIGQYTLDSLEQCGMTPDSRLLDVGCGALRLGYWLVRYLNPDRYCGLEPIQKYVDVGLKYAIGPDLAAEKRPRFDHNKNFDFSPFGVKFNFVVARSIFSHASPAMVCRALDSFRDNSAPNGIVLASYKVTVKADRDAEVVDVNQKASEWSWRRYATSYLQKLAEERGLSADKFGKPHNGQVWLRVVKGS
jgi:hypothetical protein